MQGLDPRNKAEQMHIEDQPKFVFGATFSLIEINSAVQLASRRGLLLPNFLHGMAFESSEHIDAFKQLIREVPGVKSQVIAILRHPDEHHHFGIQIRFVTRVPDIQNSLASAMCAGLPMCCISVPYAAMR